MLLFRAIDINITHADVLTERVNIKLKYAISYFSNF